VTAASPGSGDAARSTTGEHRGMLLLVLIVVVVFAGLLLYAVRARGSRHQP
jgi:hypothetical protein